MGSNLNTDYGDVVRARIEELKDHAEAEYEKTKKKKDPDFDRASCNPRLPEDILWELVKIYLNSPGCMNKGFILEGYPRNENDAKNIFMNKTLIQKENPAEDEEPEYSYSINEKIVP